MLPHSLKVAYFTLTKPAMAVSGTLYRRFGAPRSGVVRVHLGPGQNNYFDGWINVDANIVTAKVDVWADLRGGLPFPDRSVDMFYSHHVVEHLPDARLPFHFAEMFRCLKPGGALRVGGPNGDVAMRKFIEGDSAWFGDFPEKRRSIGGRFANFILCAGEHLAILTESYLRELLEDAHFVDIAPQASGSETGYPQWIDESVLAKEAPVAAQTLVMEARRPSSA